MITIKPGDSIVLYTDGVTEAMNRREELFGSTHLYDLLAANVHLKPRALMRLLLTELRAWSDGQVPHDDITLVILRRRYPVLHDELRSITIDVLGMEAADALWHEHVTLWTAGSPDRWDTVYWIETVVPSLTSAVRAAFNRGLARELGQQLRLAIEDYRAVASADNPGDR
jgi:sigma-B regulation protein RsbU (phosphoserine phosphatase)